MNKFIKDRIKSPYPIPKIIVSKSTPVLSFGDFRKAKVFTLGINPSNLEFENKNGELLKNNLRRLHTYNSLKVENYHNLTDKGVDDILDGCVNYFNRNPYKWFNKFDKILSGIGVSYTKPPFAAHVDLVQWATKIKWRDLSNQEKNVLIEDGRLFLEYQLESDSLDILLLNGKTVIDSFKEWNGINLNTISYKRPNGKNSNIVHGMYKNRIKIIGWSLNLQSSFGVSNEDIQIISNKVRELVRT